MCVEYIADNFSMKLTKLISLIKTMKPLNLEPDEEKIISELAKGKLQKEIDLFSHVTISKKLKEARERNNCISTDELVTKYKIGIQSK